MRARTIPKGGHTILNLKSCRTMCEIDLDSWFFDLPAVYESELSGIPIDEDNATDADYEAFDLAVTEWWDGLWYEEKLKIYETGIA